LIDIQGYLEEKKIVCFTDGSCLKNPGKGGYGILLLYKSDGEIYKKELSKGFRLTTNNRMELLAVIEAIKALKKPSPMIIFSDSKYVVDAVNKGWARSWQKKGWRKSDKSKALNSDLWQDLLELLSEEIQLFWVKAHNGQKENERVDFLAKEAAGFKILEIDAEYEKLQNKL